MTEAPDTPRLRFDGIDGAIDALRERGLRMTTPRRLVLEALGQHGLVRDEVRARFGYEARFTQLAIVWLCPACTRDQPAPGPAGPGAASK